MPSSKDRPPAANQIISRSLAFTEPSVQRTLARKAAPERTMGLGVARVASVDSALYQMTLQIIMGASDDQERLPVPIPFAAAGRAHILGAIPRVGDYCIVGWMPMETLAPKTRTPIVVGWVLPGLFPALSGAATSILSAEEADLDDTTVRQALGPLGVHRHRTIPMDPGNVVAAAAQGADMLLDDGAAIVSRRGSSVVLRDPDQTLIMRSVSAQQAAAGTRVYAGAVRRDAQLPPPGLGSNEDGDGPGGFPQVAGETGTPGTLDLLQRAGLVGADSRWTPESRQAQVAAGTFQAGDRWAHIAPAGAGDPATDAQEAAWAEWRVEVAGSARPRLPATDLADGFDAERLPDASGAAPAEAPVVRMSLGAAVGNDPFGGGRAAYGKPVRARAFSGSLPSPELAAMDPEDAADHPEDVLAFLLEVELQEGGQAFVAVDRAGRATTSLGGVPSEDSASVRAAGGIRVSAGGHLRSEAEAGIDLRDLSSEGILVASDTGPVELRGGGPGTGPGAEAAGPSVAIDAEGDMRLRASKQIQASADQVSVAASSVRMSGDLGIDVTTGGRLATSCKNGTAVYGSSREEEHGGATGPLHKRHYSPTLPGQVCEEVSYEMGDRNETFKLGSHSTHIMLGSATYAVDLGTLTLRSGANEVTLSTVGAQISAVIGVATLSSVVGTASVSGILGANLQAAAGIAMVQGMQGVTLSSQVRDKEFGPILCSGSKEPLTNLPFAFWGIGAPYHLVSR